ncbi:MAG: vWA domain-containing protein, partial [Candidatus Acidiferrales bacterium]
MRVLDALPSGDRVLLLRAEADGPPIVPFTADHAAVRRGILNAQPSSATADIPRALEIAKDALADSRRGLLVYVGPGMVDSDQARRLQDFRAEIETPDRTRGQTQFLVRLVSSDAGLDNRGITRVSLRRDARQPDLWRVLTQIKNYGGAKANVVLKYSVNGEPLGERQLALAPDGLANQEDEFTWDQGGLLQAEIEPSDSLDADNRAVVSIPAFRAVHVAVFASPQSRFAASLLSVLAIDPYVRAQMVTPGTALDAAPDVAIYQGANLPAGPPYNSIWFVNGPPAGASRVLRVIGWNAEHPVTRWIRTRDVSVRNPAALTPQPGDTVLAYADGTPPVPLIVAREQSGRRILIVGFDPQESNLPQQSAFPLLMAGGIEWMTHSVEEEANSVSTGELDLPGPVTRILRPSGTDLPFARQDSGAHLL